MSRLLPRICVVLLLSGLPLGCAGWGDRKSEVNYKSPPPAPAPVYYPSTEK